MNVRGDAVFNSVGENFGYIRGDRVYGLGGDYRGTIVGTRVVYCSTHSASIGPSKAASPDTAITP